MLEETRPRLLVHWEQEDVRARARESGLAALVLHLALVIMVLISPRFFYATPLSAAELSLIREYEAAQHMGRQSIDPQGKHILSSIQKARAVEQIIANSYDSSCLLISRTSDSLISE